MCDDDNINDNEGCKSDCSGPIDGWTCSGGDSSNPDTCVTTCGDGFMVGIELCDDGSADSQGCNFDCSD